MPALSSAPRLVVPSLLQDAVGENGPVRQPRWHAIHVGVEQNRRLGVARGGLRWHTDDQITRSVNRWASTLAFPGARPPRRARRPPGPRRSARLPAR